jgi:hypothetical protein
MRATYVTHSILWRPSLHSHLQPPVTSDNIVSLNVFQAFHELNMSPFFNKKGWRKKKLPTTNLMLRHDQVLTYVITKWSVDFTVNVACDSKLLSGFP